MIQRACGEVHKHIQASTARIKTRRFSTVMHDNIKKFVHDEFHPDDNLKAAKQFRNASTKELSKELQLLHQ